jgi:hypothetical protein
MSCSTWAGWPRWQVGAAAAAGGALGIWAQGGVVPALRNHFAGYLGLLGHFGQPMPHLPTPGRSCGPQSPSAAPR